MNELPKIPLYHVERLIAEGGTAKVYWGVDLRSGFPVAIKELKVRHLNNVVVRQKFKEVETQLYLYLQHPNIPRLIDFIEQKDQMFLVMEYVDGKNLEDYIYREIGLIPEQEALPLFLKVLDTVDYLHRNKILHLDIKSNNVMLLPGDDIKLIDLGIASRMGKATSTGFGTPAYMPPEQSEMGECGKYTDIFALGVMLFEMLTGHLPFTSQSLDHRAAINEIRYKIKHSPTPQMKSFYPLINSDLQYVVERALAKDPADRYQSCEVFGNFIRDYMDRYNINDSNHD